MPFFSRCTRLAARPKLLSCLLLAALIASPALAETDESPQALARFFQSQTKSLPSAGIDFQVTAGFAVLATGNPDSSGRYAMVQGKEGFSRLPDFLLGKPAWLAFTPMVSSNVVKLASSAVKMVMNLLFSPLCA